MSTPVVRLGPPWEIGDEGASVEVDGVLVVHCSEHGDLTSWQPAEEEHRAVLASVAAAHAADEHGGDVVNRGWMR